MRKIIPARMTLVSGALLMLMLLMSAVKHTSSSPTRIPHYNTTYKLNLQQRVVQNFEHAYVSYMRNAFPKDELKPLSCTGSDHFGGYSVTLIDALDTLAVMGFKEEFWNQVDYVVDEVRFDTPRHVSVFETTIRVLGGLLSAHALALKMVEEHAALAAAGSTRPKWAPKASAYNGGLLRRASEIADRMMSAFDTPTGIPFNEVHLCSGVDRNKGHTTCAAAAGTLLLEFGTLAAWTGNCTYLTVAKRALDGVWKHRGKNHLVGTMIDILSGAWILPEAHIGASIDSFYEYLVKAYILFGQQDYYDKWVVASRAVHKYTYHDGWFLSSSTESATGGVVGDEGDYKFNSLQAFWPGLQVLAGDVAGALDSYVKMHCIVRDWNALPEYVPLLPYTRHKSLGKVGPGFPLRPEFLESTYLLYEATRDDHFLHVAEQFLRMIESTKQRCGFAAVLDVSAWTFEDKMDSFLLAETFKYLYLVFQPSPDELRRLTTHARKEEKSGVWAQLVSLGPIVFNTEAHPVPVTSTSQSVFAQCAQHEDLFFLGHNNLQKLSESFTAHAEHIPPTPSPQFHETELYVRTPPHERGLLPDAPSSIAMCPIVKYMETVAPFIHLIFYDRDRCYDPVPAVTLGHKRQTTQRVHRGAVQHRAAATPSGGHEIILGGSGGSVNVQELVVEIPRDDTLAWSLPHHFIFTVVITGGKAPPVMHMRRDVVVLTDFPASVESLYLPENAVVAQAPPLVAGGSDEVLPGLYLTAAVYNPPELCTLNAAKATTGGASNGDDMSSFYVQRDAPWYFLRGDGCNENDYAAHFKSSEVAPEDDNSNFNSLRSLSGMRKKGKKIPTQQQAQLEHLALPARFGIAVARGGCTFKEKTRVAEKLGASFLIVVTPGTVLVSLADGGPHEGSLYVPTIPTFMMTERDLEFFPPLALPTGNDDSMPLPSWATQSLAPIQLLCTLTAKAQLKAMGIRGKQFYLPSSRTVAGSHDTQSSSTVLLYRDRMEASSDIVYQELVAEAVNLRKIQQSGTSNPTNNVPADRLQ